MDSTFYRCNEVKGDEEDCQNKQYLAINQTRMVRDNHTLDDNRNLMRYDDHGEATSMCDPETAMDRNKHKEQDEKRGMLGGLRQDDSYLAHPITLFFSTR